MALCKQTNNTVSECMQTYMYMIGKHVNKILYMHMYVLENIVHDTCSHTDTGQYTLHMYMYKW